MAQRPHVVLAFSPAIHRGLVRPAQLERLRSLCSLQDAEPLAAFDDPRADALLADAEILLTGWGCRRIDAAVLARAPRLRAIVHAAGTVKGHVTGECFERGVVISSAAAANAVPVAEYTVAAILLANKRVFALRERYREERKFKFWAAEMPGLGNLHKTVGLLAASRVGRRVVELLQPFDLRIVLHDPTLEDAEIRALGAEPVSLDELFSQSDVVSLHAPLVPATRGLIDARLLARMPDGATFVNTARGGLVDGEALEAELVSGRIWAVIDTTEPEVLPSDSPLYALPNVFLTPHIAGAMGRETERLVDLALDEIERFVGGEPLAHPVHHEEWERTA